MPHLTLVRLERKLDDVRHLKSIKSLSESINKLKKEKSLSEDAKKSMQEKPLSKDHGNSNKRIPPTDDEAFIIGTEFLAELCVYAISVRLLFYRHYQRLEDDTKKDKEIKNLRKEMTTHKSEVANLTEELTTHKSEIENLTEELTTHKSSIVHQLEKIVQDIKDNSLAIDDVKKRNQDPLRT